jgi:hypothetical protein
MTDDQRPHDPLGLRKFAENVETAFRPIAEALHEAREKLAESHAGGTERPAEGTAHGEAPGGAERPAAGGVTSFADYAASRAERDRMTELVMAGLERDRPRGKVDAVDDLSALRAVVLDAVDARIAWDSPLTEVSDEGLGRIIAAVWQNWRTAERDRVEAERDALRGKVEAVRALHGEYEGRCLRCITWCECNPTIVDQHQHNAPWPCPTIQALDGGS